MRQLSVAILMGICLYIYGCGEGEISGPTEVVDTTPPTILGANVQGGSIPVNTPVILIFDERINLTSAQRGVSVRSTIDAKPVAGVITLDNDGREVKFTPTERMTSGGYVLTAIGIQDTAENVLPMPITIFFGAVEVDTTQPGADVIPPIVVSTIPADGQSAETTNSLIVRFDEEVDPASAQAGILLSGVLGRVDVIGAVATFTPQEPMQTGVHTLAITGVRDLSGNILQSSVIVSFEVIGSDILKPPDGGVLPQGGVLFRAFSKDRAVPNADAEDPGEWSKRNVTPGLNVYTVEGGRLKQTSDGCGNSTKTPAPVDGFGWTDYLVAADVWSRDNDVFSLLFRYTDANNYYNFTIGASEYDQEWALGDSTAIEGACFDSAPPPIDSGPHGIVIDESGGTAYTIAARVTGSKIELFFGEQVDVARGELPPKVGEAIDSSQKKGTIGFHSGSNPFDLANILVFGSGGPQAVDGQGKAAAVWGALRSAYSQ